MKKQNKTERMLFGAFYRGNQIRWACVMVFSVIDAGLDVLIAWLLKESVDVITRADINRLRFLVAVGAGLFVFYALVGAVYQRLKARFYEKAISQYKNAAFSVISGKSISAFSQEHTGRYLSVLTSDVGELETNYLHSSFALVGQIVRCIASAAMMLLYSPKLAGVCLLLSAVPVGISLAMGPEQERRTTKASDQGEAFAAQIKDLLSGFSVLKSFKAETAARSLFEKANESLETAKFRRRWWNGLFQEIQGMSSFCMQFDVVFLGAYMAIRGELSPGTAIAMINLSGNLVNAISGIPENWTNRRSAKALVRKMARIAQENTQRHGEPVPACLEQGITLEQVSFAYEPGKPVLREVSMALEAGRKYAIVGGSGSGKSTLLNLLMGACESYSGSVAIDGRELRTLDPDGLYDLISLISQKVFLFDNTIRENITMFRTFPKDQVDSAVARSGLGPVIQTKGENYRCGENGRGLSGGEGQRVSIARSLIRGTPVLMLDEATAALDNQTAFEVTDAILRLDGLTRILVTHRLEENLLKQYDKIFVLRDGRITEQGTFRELMEKAGYIYSLYHVTNG